MRPFSIIVLLPLAASLVSCGGRTRPPSAEPGGAQTTIIGPSHAPVIELPERAAFMTAAGDAEWSAIGREANALLAAFLRINTTNPPGNELAAARFLQAVFQREGIEVDVLEPRPGKANLVARLRGDGSRRPIILLSHMDVVEATPAFWSVDPFGGVERDGFLYGRGALDMKGQGIAQLMAMVALKRADVPLARDIVYVATCDEEIGGGVGARWIAEEHPELVRGAEFLINEGGTMRADDQGRVTYVGVGVTEKSPFWLAVTARGTAGHGSQPTPDNAVERLVRALARLDAWETPFVVTPTVERFFRDLSRAESDPARRGWLADVRTALGDPAARRWFRSDIVYNALLRNTVTVTVLAGSGKTNVIPPVARAELDVRLLPGQDPQRFLAQLREVVADTMVRIEPLGVSWPATESGADTDLFRAVAEVAERTYPGALVTSSMLTGFTDSHYFRRLGIASYGVAPFPLRDLEGRGVHGNDERVRLDAMERGSRFLYDVLVRVAGR
jgi:acetylornithine deacetylase/succinyl-diaminopimelate desuccinylase-like protein